jgi:SAM-dependent methyltransferase
MDDYDALFYDSLCIPDTDPERLAVLGRLFGLQTAQPTACRVLELGAATGGNLIPMAWRTPDAELVGIDLAAEQIKAGQRIVDGLGLPNITLRQGDIAHLPDDLGSFDYIIAHGVYSWVPPDTAGALLRAGRQLLRPHGLFYVSYNTLPGWRMRGMLRDILLDAAREAVSPRDRLAAAAGALQRLEHGLTDVGGLAADYLREELRRLRDAPPSYLYHELLAREHHPVAFREFLAGAEAAGLRYLCDCDLQTLFPSRLGDSAEQALADLADGADVEQWLDFLGTRNFRQSIFFRDDTDIEEALSLEAFATLALWADLRQSHQPMELTLPGGEPVTARHPLTRAALLILAGRYPEAVPLPTLLRDAVEQLGSSTATSEGAIGQEQIQACIEELFSLFIANAIGARLTPRPPPPPLPIIAPTGPSKPTKGGRASGSGNAQWRPRATALARAQLTAGAREVATLDHRNLELDPLALHLLGRLDGTRTLADLARDLASEIAVGRLRACTTLLVTGAELPGPSQIETAVIGLMRLYLRYGLLESSGDSYPGRVRTKF